MSGAVWAGLAVLGAIGGAMLGLWLDDVRRRRRGEPPDRGYWP